MVEPTERSWPDLDPDLLLTHLDYSSWAVQKTLAMVDRLPPEPVVEQVNSSFSSILATLQHVYSWDLYYLKLMKGKGVEYHEIVPPTTWENLKVEWTTIHEEMWSWDVEPGSQKGRSPQWMGRLADMDGRHADGESRHTPPRADRHLAASGGLHSPA